MAPPFTSGLVAVPGALCAACRLCFFTTCFGAGAVIGAAVCGTGATGADLGVELDIAKMMKPTTRNAIIMIARGEMLGGD